MAENKVILYYKFARVADPEAMRLWQKNVCERYSLTGRIIVAEHGINGTLGGELADLKRYVRDLRAYPAFRDTEIKWSNGTGDEFPRLSVKVRAELVTLAPDEQFDVFDTGTGLRPAEWHQLLEENPGITLLDARNNYESEIGRFRGAITPDITAFREIKETLATLDKDAPVATYCTGDVRCEYLSAYMKHVGFREVYHLDGGIVKYGERFRDEGLWDGKCFVFDRRKHVAFSPASADLASCSWCDAPTSLQRTCDIDSCITQYVVCESCQANEPVLCPAHRG